MEEGISFVCVIALLVRSCSYIAYNLLVISCKNKGAYVKVVVALAVISALAGKSVAFSSFYKITGAVASVCGVCTNFCCNIVLAIENDRAQSKIEMSIIVNHKSHFLRQWLNFLSVNVS